MSRRAIKYHSIDDIIADLMVLKKGCTTEGRWSLPQAAWHIARAPANYLHPPATAEPTPEQSAMIMRIAGLFESRNMPDGIPASAQILPAESLGDDAVDELIALLYAVKGYAHSHVDFGVFGPVTIERFKDFLEIHSQHHFSHFKPKVARRELQYGSFDDLRSDIASLRRGATQAGSWSLAQAAYHLDTIAKNSIVPGPYPPDTDEQKARRPMFEGVMASGKIPNGLVSPEPMVPPTDTPDSAIDAYLATLDKFEHHPGEYAPHRLFGNLPRDVRQKHQLIHAAHHLSYLTPTK